jgi:hypothetical protein
MALEGAGSRRAWGYALNESRFPGARTGGEETDTVCASNTRRDAELENALKVRATTVVAIHPDGSAATDPTLVARRSSHRETELPCPPLLTQRPT